MTTLHEAAQKALELNLEELKQIATLWKNFRIGNMGDYSKRAVELLKLQSQYHAAAAPDIVLELIRQIESLRSALAQQGAYTDPDCLTRQDEIIRKLAKENAELDSQIDQLIQERDHRDEIIDKLCDAVLGPDRYEWSSMYFFEDAVREVEERMEALAQQGEQPVAWYDEEFDCAYTAKELDGGTSEGLIPLYAGAAPAAQPHVTPNQAARFRAQHLFLEWNRAQKDLPVAIAMEYHVFQNAIDLYFEAVKLNGIGVRK